MMKAGLLGMTAFLLFLAGGCMTDGASRAQQAREPLVVAHHMPEKPGMPIAYLLEAHLGALEEIREPVELRFARGLECNGD
jgi:hypothetical protein